MRRILAVIVIIIILVSLNWFRNAQAQDFSQLSDEQKQELFRKYQSNNPQNRNQSIYQSPQIYDSSVVSKKPAYPNDSLEIANSEKFINQKWKSGISRKTIPEFDQLLPFGIELFRGPRESAPPDDIASSGDYILGPGDNIIISLWGRVEDEYNLTVDREGNVFIPKIGELTAWGKKLEDFKTYAQKKFTSLYSDFNMNISLGKIRSIRVFLTGEVNTPGAYTISSLTSLFNALYLAGGPNENGSMRNVRLMRAGKAVAELDLYKFLLEGDNRSDLRLESGDAIFVPVAGTRVGIRGEVHRPAIYELKGGETALDVLTLAGKPTSQAYLDRVMLERISTKGEWEVQDVNLSTGQPKNISNPVLRDGDRLTIFSIFDAKTNMVSVSGMVKHPGYYERNDSTRISDLLQRGQLQDYDVYLERADLFRYYPDSHSEVIAINLKDALAGDPHQNIIMADRDSLHIYSIKDVQRERSVFIGGEVQRPGTYTLFNNMKVSDLIFLSGSFTRAASRLLGELAHTDSLGQVAIENLNLTDSAQLALQLSEDDRLYIRTIPEWELHRTVKIDGEVQFPGEYVLSNKTETLHQLIERCGGFTSNAFPPGTLFERKSITKDLGRLQVSHILENTQPLVMDTNGRFEKVSLMTYDSNMVSRIVIDLDKIVATDGKNGDILLQPGDRIFIPQVPSGISVMGAVGSSGTIKFIQNKKVKFYVEQAGSFTPRADKKGTRLIKANGSVFAGSDVLGKRAELGDVVVVPSKIEKEKNWFKTFTTVLATTTSVLTTVLLIDKL